MNDQNNRICKDCNKCIRPSNDKEESHMCSLCKEYVIDSDMVKLNDGVDVLSK